MTETALTLPFVYPSVTSFEARESMKDHAPSQRERVFACILHSGPVTDHQITDLLGLSENSVRPRRVELQRAGRIIETGTGKTPSGRNAVRWIVKGN